MSKKPNSLMVLVAIGLVVGLVGYFMTAPQAKVSSTIAKAPLRPQEAIMAGFDESDLKAKFTPVNMSDRNAFKPLVVRQPSGLSGALASDPSAIPPAYTGGEAGWFFTGVVEMDGISMALLENRSTGDGMYVKSGEQWKAARIVRVGSDGVVITGATGDSVTLRLNDGSNNMEGEVDEGNSPATIDGPVQGLTAVPEQGGPPQQAEAPVVIQDE